MANLPKARTSATCPARMGNKSTTSAPTLSKEVGTPATFYTNELQVLQRCFNKDRKGFYKKGEHGYLTKLFRKVRKIITLDDDKRAVVHCLTESDRGTTGAELAGNQDHDPSITVGDVIPAKQTSPSVTLPTSKIASIIASIEQRYGALAEPQERYSTVQYNFSAVEIAFEVTRNQREPVASINGEDNARVPHTDEVPVEVAGLISKNTDTKDPSSHPESPGMANGSLAVDGSVDLQPSTSQVRSHPNLRQCLSAPALTVIQHSRFGSGDTFVNTLPPSPTMPTMPTPSPPDTPVTVIRVGAGEVEACQKPGAPSPSEQSNSYNVSPNQVIDAWRDNVAGSGQEIKAAQEMDFAQRLAKAVAEAKTAKDEEWSDRLKEAVAQAEAVKDEEMENFDRFKESSHANMIKDLEEDHEHEIEELVEKHAISLQELVTKHDEELSELTRKHGLEARRLEKGRAQGVKEVKRFKDALSEMEAEKTVLEERLVHMTGQRDALSNALAALKSIILPQPVSLESSQTNQANSHRHGEARNTAETVDSDSRAATHAGADAVYGIGIPAPGSDHFQPHQHGPPSRPPMVPNDLYPRLRLVESENAQLREDLERRHEDVKYAIGKADKLRELLEEDSTKADTYADLLKHKEVIEDLNTHLTVTYEAVERERLESQRLRDQIDVVTTAAQSETLERILAVKDKETAWEQNETLLKNLKGKFGKDQFTEALWDHCESLAKEKKSLGSDIRGFKLERRNLMEEAVQFKHQIAQLELDVAKLRDRDDGAIQDPKGQILKLQVENDVLKAELEFQLAEQMNRKERPRILRAVQGRVLEGGEQGDCAA